MSTIPRISVIVPSYNQGLFLQRTINSLLSQRYSNLEIIVIDGGSTDNSRSVLNKFEDKIIGTSEKDRGQAHAINKGLKKATGEIISFLNSDDTLAQGAIKKIAYFFSTHSDVDILYGKVHHIDSNDHFLNKYDSFWTYAELSTPSDIHFSEGCLVGQPSVFWRRKIIDEIGLFNTKLNYAFDYEYWIRISKKYKFYYLPEHLANTRLHPDTKTSNSAEKVFEEMAIIQLKYYRQVHLAVILSLIEIKNSAKTQISRISRTRHLLSRIVSMIWLQLTYNHRLPTKKMLTYILIWIKEIFA